MRADSTSLFVAYRQSAGSKFKKSETNCQLNNRATDQVTKKYQIITARDDD